MIAHFVAKQLFDGEQIFESVPFSVADGTLVNVGGDAAPEAQQLDGLVAPGFIDLQVNGGGGVLFNQSPSLSNLTTIMKTHARFGTTSMLPTLITDKIEVMQGAAKAVASALKQSMPGILGIHFEGPHLSSEKKGVHPAKWLRPTSNQELSLYARKDLGIKLLTVAPEMVTTAEIKELVEQHGVKVSLGHSNADYDVTKRAVDAGATGFTHLYNAMSAIQSRSAGVVGAALDHASCWSGIILDGHHVSAASARVANKTLPKGKLFLVTDAMAAVGTEKQNFEFFDTEITRIANKLTVPSGALAGSVLDMNMAVVNAVKMLEIEISEALRMAALYPAQFLGIDDRIGSLKEGLQADFVVLDERLIVQSTWIGGRRFY